MNGQTVGAVRSGSTVNSAYLHLSGIRLGRVRYQLRQYRRVFDHERGMRERNLRRHGRIIQVQMQQGIRN